MSIEKHVFPEIILEKTGYLTYNLPESKKQSSALGIGASSKTEHSGRKPGNVGAYEMHFVDAKGILTGSGGYYGMNLYRGCSHGCIYCDSRSKCYRFTHPFEDIEVKQNAPVLLEAALRSKRKKFMIGTGSMSDPYMHCEEELGLTRRCLEIIQKYGFGVAVQTKSDRILRDIDLLDEINRQAKAVVQMTLTTFDEELCRVVEPNVCSTGRRVEVLEAMQKRKIPTVVWMTPIRRLSTTRKTISGRFCRNASGSA